VAPPILRWRATQPTPFRMPGKGRESTPPDRSVSMKVSGRSQRNPLQSPLRRRSQPRGCGRSETGASGQVRPNARFPAREGGERPPRTRRREWAAGTPAAGLQEPLVPRATRWAGKAEPEPLAGRPACASVMPTRFGLKTGRTTYDRLGG
jgi:hypothetical protein